MASIKLTPMPVYTETVTRPDRKKAFADLQKGPKAYACSFEHAKSVYVYIRQRCNTGCSMRAVEVNGEVVGYTLALHDHVKKRSHKEAAAK